ncbi:hypothetical protein, variant [Pyricularia oryzae 70-15]|uniref:Uncharacterized protein n=1 Tax=Pyricularia oryzae (strain 70-15 / ATCC MYA-4617 / FGSC 8958) TaxID=242507 RepID=G4MLA1_PYRO7|nr:hypothetical protein, variant [Pyricularia oryzae 70-15]EHA57630.1 hypothetical protein, variant [Pyricularia oryzae 70-15]
MQAHLPIPLSQLSRSRLLGLSKSCNGLPITERGSAADLPRSPRKTRRDEKKIFQPAQNSQDGAIEAVIFPGELPRNRLLRHCYFSLKHQGAEVSA